MAIVEPTPIAGLADGIMVRSAEVSHSAALASHLVGISEPTYRVVTTPGEMMQRITTMPMRIGEWRDDPNRVWLVAVLGSVVIGEASLRRHQQERLSHVAQLGMSVAESWQRRGIGTALLTAAISWARGRGGIRKVALSVLAENSPAISLYRKFGFVEEGRRAGHVQLGTGDYADDLVMGLQLPTGSPA